MFKKYYSKIADLLLYAVNFKAGDKIQLSIDFDCRDIAKQIVSAAYRRGARFVELNYHDPFLRAEAILGTRQEIWFPEYLQKKDLEIIQPGWKSIAVLSDSEADVYEGLPPEKSSAYFKKLGQLKKIRMEAVMTNQVPWTITYIPSELMAQKAFPDLSANEAVKRYWEAIIEIMHLDEDDPIAFWKSKMKKDRERSNFMNELAPEYLHFKGPGTDLMVGINKKANWIGGWDLTPDGQKFISNIPTDEIFTSPDWRKTEGRVTLTRPFVMHQNLGPVPEEAWFEFREGKVMDYGAEKGKESLTAFFNIDERAAFIGEVALVDPESPFAATGITYYNGLYDENAACHLALGKAYPFTLKEKVDYTNEELLEIGMNPSTVHEDMMIGGTDVDVTAVLSDGQRKPVIKDGKFLI